MNHISIWCSAVTCIGIDKLERLKLLKMIPVNEFDKGLQAVVDAQQGEPVWAADKTQSFTPAQAKRVQVSERAYDDFRSGD